MKSLAQINTEVSAAYQAALRDAKESCGNGIYRSRGKWIYVEKNGNSLPQFEGESVEWNGSIKQIKSLVAEHPDCSIGICGGIDYGDNFAAFEEGWYEPWAGEWNVYL